MKKILFPALLLLLIYLSLELFSFIGLTLLKNGQRLEYNPILTSSLCPVDQKTLEDIVQGKTTYLLHSPTLGWTIKPHGYWDNLYRANAQGLRGDHDYLMVPRPQVIRIATFGDSFTHGEEVKNEDTWQEQLDRLNHNLEVINCGVGGYGLDQSFLRYQIKGVLYNPHIVCIGFMEENINRLVNRYRSFYVVGIPLTKPRYIVRDHKLVLLQNPMTDLNACRRLLNNPQPHLSQFGALDYHFQTGLKDGPLDFFPSIRLLKLLYHSLYARYREYAGSSIYKNGYFNQQAEAFAICTKLFEEFYSEVLKHGALPIIILFPNKEDMERYRNRKTKVYAPLIDYLNAQGYRYIDLMDAFEKTGSASNIKDFFIAYHYSPLGNSAVAHYILDYLNKNRFTDMQVITEAIRNQQNRIDWGVRKQSR